MMTLEDIAAHLEIRQALYRYCRGVDRGEAEAISTVYHPDAHDSHGCWQGLGRDFAAYLVPAMDAAPLIGQHHITNVLIDLQGDAADVESYFIAFHPQAEESTHALVCGRYLDRFERRGGVWAIAGRQVVVDVSRQLDPGRPWPGAAFLPKGGRREADPSSSRTAPSS